MSPDPSGGSVRLGNPQSWNRYSYVVGDPINGNGLDGLASGACGSVSVITAWLTGPPGSCGSLNPWSVSIDTWTSYSGTGLSQGGTINQVDLAAWGELTYAQSANTAFWQDMIFDQCVATGLDNLSSCISKLVDLTGGTVGNLRLQFSLFGGQFDINWLYEAGLDLNGVVPPLLFAPLTPTFAPNPPGSVAPPACQTGYEPQPTTQTPYGPGDFTCVAIPGWTPPSSNPAPPVHNNLKPVAPEVPIQVSDPRHLWHRE